MGVSRRSPILRTAKPGGRHNDRDIHALIQGIFNRMISVRLLNLIQKALFKWCSLWLSMCRPLGLETTGAESGGSRPMALTLDWFHRFPGFFDFDYAFYRARILGLSCRFLEESCGQAGWGVFVSQRAAARHRTAPSIGLRL